MMQTDTILILNASEGILQIVVGTSDNKLLAHEEWDCPNNGTEKLTPYIKELFSKLNLPLVSIRKIACIVGAGSFTGIRLCMMTAEALARALSNNDRKIELVGIDYLYALAHNAPMNENARIRVITHAKKNLVHSADFTAENSIPTQVDDTRLISPNEALEELCSCEKAYANNYLLGSGVNKISQELRDLSTKTMHEKSIILLNTYNNFLNAHALLKLANEKEQAENTIDAFYVRSCDAVDNLEHISNKLGNNAQEALKLYKKIIN